MTRAAARGCIQAASYHIQRRFAAEKWVMRDDDPPVGRRAVARFLWSGGVARFLLCTKKPPAVLRRAGGGIFWETLFGFFEGGLGGCEACHGDTER